MTEVRVEGTADPGFERVAESFARNFADHGDIGASFALYHHGRRVVHLWGGLADPSTGRPYRADTLQLIFSSTKGAVAACANLLAQRGQIDIDAPVARYWPEFGQAGKDRITVRWILSHQGGLPYVDGEFSLAEILDGRPIVRALERQAPAFEPGSTHCYHAITYGWLVGEVIRRVAGVSVGSFFQQEIAGPLGLDFWIGLPASEFDRVAPLQEPDPPDPAFAGIVEQYLGPGTPFAKSSFAGVLDVADWNGADIWTCELPAGNGIATADSLARMYAGLIGPVEGYRADALLTPAQVDAARTTQNQGPDWLYAHVPGLEVMITYGLGFMTPHLPTAPYGWPGAFGHSGAGGSFGFGDPDHGIAAGYVMNKGSGAILDPRRVGLARAVYESIGVAPTGF